MLSAPAARAAIDAARTYGLFNNSAHPSAEATPRNEDALVGTLLHVSVGPRRLRLIALPVRSYPTATAQQRGGAHLQREHDRACSNADLMRHVAVHKLTKPAEMRRCAELAEGSRSLAPRPCAVPPDRREWLRLRGLMAHAAEAAAAPAPVPVPTAPAVAHGVAGTFGGGLYAQTGGGGGGGAGAGARIAFCFLLAYGDVTQPSLWLRFFGRSPANQTAPGRYDHLYNVYVHHHHEADEAGAGVTAAEIKEAERQHRQRGSSSRLSMAPLRQPFWRAALLPRAAQVHTSYRNGTSLDLARMALMRFALAHDQRNFKFVLLSESCIPLHPLPTIHAMLTRDPRPRVHEYPDLLTNPPPAAALGAPDKSRGKRWVPSLSPLLPEAHRNALLQQRQFVVASRKEIELFPRPTEILALFGPMPRAEEHIFLNVLVHRLGYRRGADIDVGCVTYQRFTRARGEHYRVPLTCRRTAARGLELEREADLLRAKQSAHGGCLFARKFAPTCDLSCLAATGFERFRC